MFHMGKVLRSRKVIRDVTYKWIPFLFVVLTVIVSTALLSTSGKPPRGIVVTSSVMAGLLVFFFLSCHLMLYCTRIRREMDTEGANDDNGNADLNPQLGGNIPPGSNVNTKTDANFNTEAQQRVRDQIEHHDTGRDEQHRHNQYHPDHRMGRHAQTHSPAAQPDVRRLDPITSYEPYQPPRRSDAETRGQPQQPLRTSDQPPWERSSRHSSALPAPLNPKPPPRQPESNQQRSQPDLPLERLPSGGPQSQSRHTSGGYLHSKHSSRSQTEVTGPPPRETARRHRAAPGGTEPREALQRRTQDYKFPERANAVRRKNSELCMPQPPGRFRGGSAHADMPADQAGPREYSADTPNDVQAHFALLGGLDVWGRVSRFLSEMKPRSRLRRKSADDYLELEPVVADDAYNLVVFRDTGRKIVHMHPAAAEVERIRSQKVLVQRIPSRASNDSGYYTADSNQHPPPPPPQHPGPSTINSSTLVSSAASTYPPASSGTSISSSPSAESEQHSPYRHSVSSMGSEWMSWNWRVSMGHQGTIRVMVERPLRDARPRPRGRSKTC